MKNSADADKVLVAVKWLRIIRDFKPKEVVKDDFGYDRLVLSYKEAAKKALKEIRST